MELLPTLRFIVSILGFALVGALVAVGIHFYGKSKPKSSKVNQYGSDILMLLFIVAVFAVAGFGYNLVTSLQVDYTPSPTRIPSALRVITADGEDIDINFYWDVLAQDPVRELDYGEFDVLSSSSRETWCRNEALIDVWLTLNWENLNPPDADQYIHLDWNWVKLIDTWKAYPEEFSIINAQLVCTPPQPVDPIIIARAEPGFNYEITTRTKVTASATNRPETQIVFRYRDSQNYYFAGIGPWGYYGAIGKLVDGQATRIAQGGNPSYVDISLNTWYDVKVRVAGSTFTLYINDTEICSIEDTSIGYGDIGLRALYSDVVWDSYVAVNAFNPEDIIFEDYFVGAPLDVSTSRKVTFTVTSTAAAPITDEDTWDFSFDSVITAYDNPRDIKYPESP